MFLQFKYLLILLSIAKLPLKRKSSIRTNDSVSVQRDSARGSAGLFLTAYLNSKEIQNQKCMQMMACFACWCFYDSGLAYSGGAQYVLSFSNINQNYFMSPPHPWSPPKQTFPGVEGLQFGRFTFRLCLMFFYDCFKWKDIRKALGFLGMCITQKTLHTCLLTWFIFFFSWAHYGITSHLISFTFITDTYIQPLHVMQESFFALKWGF